jgi:Bacterial membrane protein YfhO
VIACAACLLVPAIFGKPEISPWIGLSIVLIFCSYGLFRWILHGNRRPFAKVLVVGLILFDLSAFDWTALNIMDVRKNGVDHLQRNLSLEGVNRFLDAQRKPQAAPFRVQVDAVDRKPNIGDLFGIQSPDGGAVTLPADYTGIAGNRDLLNVRYVVKPASAQDPGPVYRDSAWKVYENPGALPRAWLVHELVVSAPAGPPAYDASSTALLNGGINETIEPAVHPEQEGVVFSSYRAQRLELTVRAQSRAMLVLSETFYPGWRATVNGASQRIYKVDGDLRGVVVPRGDSTIVLEYRPLSVYAGALLTILACAAAVAFTRIARSAKEVS